MEGPEGALVVVLVVVEVGERARWWKDGEGSVGVDVS